MRDRRPVRQRSCKTCGITTRSLFAGGYCWDHKPPDYLQTVAMKWAGRAFDHQLTAALETSPAPAPSTAEGGEAAMLDRNGNSETVHLIARMDQLALALDHVTRELAETWGPRLIELERDVGDLLRILRGRLVPPADAGDEE